MGNRSASLPPFFCFFASKPQIRMHNPSGTRCQGNANIASQSCSLLGDVQSSTRIDNEELFILNILISNLSLQVQQVRHARSMGEKLFGTLRKKKQVSNTV